MQGGWLAVALVAIAPGQMPATGRPALIDPSTGMPVAGQSDASRPQRVSARWRAVGETERWADGPNGDAMPPLTLPTMEASSGVEPPSNPERLTDEGHVRVADGTGVAGAGGRGDPGVAVQAPVPAPPPGVAPVLAPSGPVGAAALQGCVQSALVTVEDAATGLVWREYDIQPYTLRVASTRRPEQGVIDWILRTTGTHVWHGEEPAVLSADHQRLRVYHNESVQAHVAQLLPRFTAAGVDQFALRLHVLTVGDLGWRREFYWLLRPLPQEQREGGPSSTRIWTLEPEDAALVLARLRARRDYRDHGSPYMLVDNGQAATLQATQERSYVSAIRSTPGAWPGFQAEVSTIREGLTLELSPLAAVGAGGALDGRAVELYMQGNVQHVERLHDVTIDTPASFAPGQRASVQVPQLAEIGFEERVVWPTDKVLVINPGMVPLPSPEGPRLLDLGGPARGDLLILIESAPAADALRQPLAETHPQALRAQYRYAY